MDTAPNFTQLRLFGSIDSSLRSMLAALTQAPITELLITYVLFRLVNDNATGFIENETLPVGNTLHYSVWCRSPWLFPRSITPSLSVPVRFVSHFFQFPW